MKTVEIKARSGLRNEVSGERFTPDDLLSGSNVDLDKTGKLSRRLGTLQLSAGATTSLWAEGDSGFYVRGGSLYQLHADLTATVVATNVGERVTYVRLGSTVYWSDGTKSGRVNSGANRSWGIAPPTNSYLLSAAAGDLPAGTYGVTLVYMRDGMESGAPRGQYITLPAASGLSLTGLPVSSDPSVTEKALYITNADGGVFFRAAILPNATTALTVYGAWSDTLALRTQFKSAAPAGHLVGIYNGRAYVAQGNALFYSDPYEYELFDLRSSYIPFSATPTIFAPVKDGLFVATETETVFLQGSDPSTFVSTQVAPYGGVPGTLTYPRNDLLLEKGVQGEAAMWYSTNGVCLGTAGGEFVNLTGSRYVSPAARRGSGLFKMRSGTPQYLATLFN